MEHLKLSEREAQRLAQRIDEDYRTALSDHQSRIERFRRLYRLWRSSREAAAAAGEEESSNYQVPMLRWFTLAELAKVLQSLLGEDAQVVAAPVGPSDQRTCHKAGRFITWRVFTSMQITIALARFLFRVIVYGRSHVYMPYERRAFDTPSGPRVSYEGPAFVPVAPDDLIVPSTPGAETIHDFPFAIRRVRLSPQQLLIGEEEGRYYGIEENFEKIVRLAEHPESRDMDGGDQIAREEDEAEGVTREAGASSHGTVIVFEWYGRWRLLKKKDDADESDLRRRELRETDLVVRYIPQLNLVIGAQRLMDLYPRMEKRRPFEEACLMDDGTYWGPGFGEWIENAQGEASQQRNIAQESSELAACPAVFYQPASGLDPGKLELAPKTTYPCADPRAINVVRVEGNIQGLILMQQATRGDVELVTGINDQTLGRAIDRPNAPRTAAGQTLLAEQANIRGFLDVLFLREAFKRIFRRVWELDAEFSPEALFFRVTEEESKGLFETQGGGATMTAEEFAGRFDFDIKFATSYLSREAEKARQMQLYQLDLQNPLIATNPKALYAITQRLHKAMGDDEFGDVVPEPPDLGLPKNPNEEWTLMLQGEDDIEPTPVDNDDLHLTVHHRQLAQEVASTQPDEDAIHKMVQHIAAHEQQKRVKMLMQAMAGQAAQGLQRMQEALGGLRQPAPPEQAIEG